MILPGTILLHKAFQFADGSTANKYLVVLAYTASHLVVAKTTSKGNRYRLDHGCQAASQFPAFLLTQGCCCLPLNTWVCLSEFYELALSELVTKMIASDIVKFGVLSNSLTRDVQVCAVGCDDISQAQEQQVRASFVDDK
jgi:hypothetical protein